MAYADDNLHHHMRDDDELPPPNTVRLSVTELKVIKMTEKALLLRGEGCASFWVPKALAVWLSPIEEGKPTTSI